MRVWVLILPERHRQVAAPGAIDLVARWPCPAEPCPHEGLVRERIAR